MTRIKNLKRGNLIIILLILNLFYPAIACSTDSDGNGIQDEFELPLARKFSPSLILHLQDQGVCPKPVEIIGTHSPRNLWIRTFNVPLGQLVGEYNCDQFYPTIWYYMCEEMGHPEFCSGNYSFLDLNGWLYLGRPSGKAYAYYYLVFHWDWAGPGNDSPSSWYSHYHNVKNSFPNTIYAHLFKLNATQYVVQYWFFYPFNDFVNDHEGDWEHINVIINGQDPATANILWVEYFFHHKVDDRTSPGYDYHLDGLTHPVVFVGGYEKVDYGGSSGEGSGSHGSYPIYGFWKDTGNPIPGYGRPDETVDGLGHYLKYNTLDIKVIPNPDAIDYNENPSMSWLKANLPWGHIQVSSYGDWLELIPFLGAEVGNNAPLGPPYNPGWNDVGDVRNEDNGYVWYTTSNQGPIASWSPPNVSVTLTSPNGGEEWNVGSTYDITWNSENFYGNLRIEYSTDNGVTWSSVVESTPNDGVFSWALPNTVSSAGRVRIANYVDGDPADVSDNSFTILPGPVYAPVITAELNNGVLLSWADNNAYELGYKVERKAGSGGTWQEIATTPQNATTFLDHRYNLVGSETYTYRVRAYNQTRFSDYSNIVSIKNRPNPARNLSGYVVKIRKYDNNILGFGINGIGPEPPPEEEWVWTNKIVLNWRPPLSQKPPVSYNIYYRYYKDGYWSWTWYKLGPIYDTTLTRCFVPDYTIYFYVYSLDPTGDSGWYASNTIDLTTGTETSVCEDGGSAKVVPARNEYKFDLSQNFPNPFNPNTKIEFSLPQPSKVKLEVFNVLGQKVVTLIDGEMEAGVHSVIWDGRDEKGMVVSDGVYFYRIIANKNNQVKKMILLK